MIDFKQNLIVGHCPEEEHWVFRQLSQRTWFNVTVFTKTKIHRFDIISNCLKHSSLFVKQALRQVFNLGMMKNLLTESSTDTIKFWADNAGHFKSYKFVYFSLIELPQQNTRITKVSMNYFTPYHGKSDCDIHFGNISYWMEYYSNHWKNGIQNTKDICMAIRRGSEMSKQMNRKYRLNSGRFIGRDDDITIAIDFDIETIGKAMADPLIEYYGIEHRLKMSSITSL